MTKALQCGLLGVKRESCNCVSKESDRLQFELLGVKLSKLEAIAKDFNRLQFELLGVKRHSDTAFRGHRSPLQFELLLWSEIPRGKRSTPAALRPSMQTPTGVKQACTRTK
jgi:hypothetical protein